MSRAYDNAADGRYQQGGRRNLIINGNFDVWQRGTSFTADNVYTADRWKSADGSGGSPARTLSRQAFTLGQTDVPGEPTYYTRHAQTAAATNSDSNLAQKIEDVRTGAAQTVTLSFWAKADATLNIRLRWRQNFGSSGSSTVNTNIADAFTIGTSWAKYTYTQTLPSISGKTISGGDDHLEVQLEFTDSGTFTFDIAQVQLETGTVATPFEHRSYGEELALCQRYYEKSYSSGTAPGSNTTVGMVRTSVFSIGDSTAFEYLAFNVSKRAAPTMTAYRDGGASGKWYYARNGQATEATVTFNHTGTEGTNPTVNIGTTWAGANTYGHWTADAEL